MVERFICQKSTLTWLKIILKREIEIEALIHCSLRYSGVRLKLYSKISEKSYTVLCDMNLTPLVKLRTYYIKNHIKNFINPPQCPSKITKRLLPSYYYLKRREKMSFNHKFIWKNICTHLFQIHHYQDYSENKHVSKRDWFD